MSAIPSPTFRVAASDLFADDDDDDDLFEDEETLVYVQIDDDDSPDVSWSMVEDDELYGEESEVTLCDRSIEIDVSELRSPPRPPPPLPRLALPTAPQAARTLPSPPRAPAPPRKRRPLPFKARPVSPWSVESYRGRVIAVKARRRKDVGPPVPPPWLTTPPVDTPSSSTAPVTLPASPDEIEERRSARLLTHDESRSTGQSFVLALACGAIGALLYVGAQRYEAPHAHAAAPAPAWTASTATDSSGPAAGTTASAAVPASAPRAVNATPPASASAAPHAPSASVAKHVTPPKHSAPSPAAPAPPKRATVADRTTNDGVEKALSDARRETDSTL